MVGSGGHACVVADCAELLGYKLQIYDHDSRKWNTFLPTNQVEIQQLDPNLWGRNNNPKQLHICVGDNTARAELYAQYAENHNVTFPLLVHPKSTVSKYSFVSDGCFVAAGAIVEANAKIGRGCIINTNSSVNHDCQLEDFVHIAPGATLCGAVKVGQHTLIGANATILPRLVVGKHCIIGAGSVVTKNVPDNTTIVGNPGVSLSAAGQLP